VVAAQSAQDVLEEAQPARGQGAQDCEAALVKLVRLIANVTISPNVGISMSSEASVVDALLGVLGCKRMPESEELVLCATAAITNLLFYDSEENLLLTPENKELICKQLRPMLLESYNVEALVEAARALGNLSRHTDARQWIAELRIDEVLVILLAHSDRDLVFYACGALVNLAADESARKLCDGQGLRAKLASLLSEVPSDDEDMLLVAVKVLSNLRLDPADEENWPAEEIESLLSALHRVCGICDADEDGLSPEGREVLRDLASKLLTSLPQAQAA